MICFVQMENFWLEMQTETDSEFDTVYNISKFKWLREKFCETDALVKLS